jgi:hypothetical protein
VDAPRRIRSGYSCWRLARWLGAPPNETSVVHLGQQGLGTSCRDGPPSDRFVSGHPLKRIVFEFASGRLVDRVDQIGVLEERLLEITCDLLRPVDSRDSDPIGYDGDSRRNAFQSHAAGEGFKPLSEPGSQTLARGFRFRIGRPVFWGDPRCGVRLQGAIGRLGRGLNPLSKGLRCSLSEIPGGLLNGRKRCRKKCRKQGTGNTHPSRRRPMMVP